LDVFTKRKSGWSNTLVRKYDEIWWDGGPHMFRVPSFCAHFFWGSYCRATGWQCLQPIFLCWTPQPLRPGTSARMSLSHRDECPGSNLRPVFQYIIYIYLRIW
jgi:hypothetical protein